MINIVLFLFSTNKCFKERTTNRNWFKPAFSAYFKYSDSKL